MDISRTTNTSSINSPHASFDNLIIPDNYLSKNKITVFNTSLDNLSIEFVDPDDNNAYVNKKVSIPFDISFFYPHTKDAVNELYSLNYIEVP